MDSKKPLNPKTQNRIGSSNFKIPLTTRPPPLLICPTTGRAIRGAGISIQSQEWDVTAPPFQPRGDFMPTRQRYPNPYWSQNTLGQPRPYRPRRRYHHYTAPTLNSEATTESNVGSMEAESKESRADVQPATDEPKKLESVERLPPIEDYTIKRSETRARRDEWLATYHEEEAKSSPVNENSPEDDEIVVFNQNWTSNRFSAPIFSDSDD